MVWIFSPLTSVENFSTADVTCIGRPYFIPQEHVALTFLKNVFKIAIMNEVEIP